MYPVLSVTAPRIRRLRGAGLDSLLTDPDSSAHTEIKADQMVIPTVTRGLLRAYGD